jgi:hypothetical protein
VDVHLIVPVRESVVTPRGVAIRMIINIGALVLVRHPVTRITAA